MAQESTSAENRTDVGGRNAFGLTGLISKWMTGRSWQDNNEALKNWFTNRLPSQINDYFTGEESQKRQYNYDMLKLEEQERFEKEMWEKTNAYNSTPAQLARWKAAGGNPNAFFGGGTNTGNASSVSAPAGGAGVGNTIGTIQGAVGQTADAIKTWWDARKAKADAEGREIENGTLRQLNEATIAEIIQRTKNDEAEGKLSEAQAKAILEMLPYQKNKTTAEIDKMKEEINTMLEQQKQIQAMTRNLRADTRKKVEERRKLEWERTFRDTFGVDPNTGPMQMLIQNILQGKGDQVLDTIFKYLEGIENETQKIVGESKVSKILSYIDRYAKDPIKFITDETYRNNIKTKDWRNH